MNGANAVLTMPVLEKLLAEGRLCFSHPRHMPHDVDSFLLDGEVENIEAALNLIAHHLLDL